MDYDDERLKQTLARFLAESKKYDARFEGLEESIVNDFLDKLKQRKKLQNEILQSFADEAKKELRQFQNVRTDFTVRLSHISSQWSLLAGTAQRVLISRFLSPGQQSPIKPGITPLETVTALVDKLDKNRQSVASTHAELQTVLRAALRKWISALDGATGLIRMRSATLRVFQQTNLMSTLEQFREKAGGLVEDELLDAFTEETAKEVAELLLEQGVDLGADLVPGAKIFIKLARAYFQATKAPEKFNDIGGGDIVMDLVASLRNERKAYEKFVDQLETTFTDFEAVQKQLSAI